MDIEPAGDSGGATSAGAGSPTSTTVAPESASPSTTTAAGETTNKGPIPYERFDEINRKYGALKWAEAHDPDRVRQQAQFFHWLDADPEGAFRYMESFLSRAGVLKANQEAVRAGNGNGNGRPQPDIVVPETGQRFYSAEAAEKLAKWEAAEATRPIAERLDGFEADRTRQQAHNEAARLLAAAETWPHYKAHEADILREMERDHRLSLEGAYQRVVIPKLRELERNAVLKEIKQKSEASTASPQSQSASQSLPASKMSWSEVFRREMAKRGGRT